VGIADKVRQACRCLIPAAKPPFNRLTTSDFFNLVVACSFFGDHRRRFCSCPSFARTVEPIHFLAIANTLAAS
jgi:hypothetical protein